MIQVAPGDCDGEVGSNFPRGAGGNPVVVEAILTRTPGAFGDVARNRRASAFELQSQILVVVADAFDRRAERGNHLKSHFVDLEAFHWDLLCRGLKQAAACV